ncbi:hypothetical protein [Streptomyces sp. NPDC051014]|uniref:hypothetical protein n=1 Tax=Streptomyces sp. NPDC051014 TaxID=3155751 RepID=UPI003400564E
MDEASPRIVQAMNLPDPGERGYACTAVGTAARLNGRLTPELFAALRAEGPDGRAEDAGDDTPTFVPYRDLPPWFRRRWVYAVVCGRLENWRASTADVIEGGRRTLRGRH